MSEPPRSGLAVRLLDANGTTVGLGALVGPRHILTCAHVVNAALGRNRRSQEEPVEEITVDFAGGDGPPLRARVQRWLPPPRAGAAGDDIAGLVLTGAKLPTGASPAHLAANRPVRDQVVDVFGYPGTPPRPDGAWVKATVRGQLPGGRHLQLDAAPDSALRIQPGFSGAPVYDRGSGPDSGPAQRRTDRELRGTGQLCDHGRTAAAGLARGARPPVRPAAIALRQRGQRADGPARVGSAVRRQASVRRQRSHPG